MSRSSRNKETEESERIDIYIREARRWKLLTREEERVLASKCTWEPQFTGEIIPDHVKKHREEFFKRNMRLVVSMANKYGTNNSGITQADLVQEGSIGLMRAIEKFDHTRGIKFSTYAVWWIRQAMTRAVYHTSSLVHLPSGVASHKHKLNRILNSPAYAGNSVSRGEGLLGQVSEDTGWDVSYIERLLDAPTTRSATDEELVNVASDLDIDSELEVCIISERINKLFARQSVPDRDVSIFWDWVTDDHTLSEIGTKHGITRERVRQILLGLISRVQTSSGIRNLQPRR